MSLFELYFRLGWKHIINYQEYEHLLFVIAICAVFSAKDIIKIIIIFTIYTISHVLTLTLATLEVVRVNTAVFELLIPATVLITAVSNLLKTEKAFINKNFKQSYFFAGIFGIIHGLGFSSFLQSLLGVDKTILTQSLGFSIGIELAQITIFIFYVFISFFFVDLFGIVKRDWNLMISSAIAGISLVQLLENWPF